MAELLADVRGPEVEEPMCVEGDGLFENGSARQGALYNRAPTGALFSLVASLQNTVSVFPNKVFRKQNKMNTPSKGGVHLLAMQPA